MHKMLHMLKMRALLECGICSSLSESDSSLLPDGANHPSVSERSAIDTSLQITASSVADYGSLFMS